MAITKDTNRVFGGAGAFLRHTLASFGLGIESTENRNIFMKSRFEYKQDLGEKGSFTFGTQDEIDLKSYKLINHTAAISYLYRNKYGVRLCSQRPGPNFGMPRNANLSLLYGSQSFKGVLTGELKGIPNVSAMRVSAVLESRLADNFISRSVIEIFPRGGSTNNIEYSYSKNLRFGITVQSLSSESRNEEPFGFLGNAYNIGFTAKYNE